MTSVGSEAARFGKPADTIVYEEHPLNAEPPRAALARTAITPAERFYVRGHGEIPELSARTSVLRVTGLVEESLTLSLEQLRDGFASVEVVATLQCAGNRRADMAAVREIPGEEPWGPGATGTAVWCGVRLADVLASAGVRAGARHVAFIGADRSWESGPVDRFAGSVPLEKARRPEVLLAWRMNGQPLPAVHGGPLRVVVPGYISARSVKWLQEIEARADPWDGYFQSTVYRLLRAGERPAPGRGIELGEILLNADVMSADDAAPGSRSGLELRGYALAGGGRSVARVEVSCDGAATWQEAKLLDDLGRWAWRLWSLRVELPPGEHQILVRAWDTSGATQPESPATLWNPKGYMNTAWGRLKVTVPDLAPAPTPAVQSNPAG
jgi:sulfite oxidase